MSRDVLLGESARSWSRGDPVIVWTPSAVRAEFNRIRNHADLVNREVSQAALDGKILSLIHI